VAVQADAPAGQVIQDVPTNEYPTIQERIAVYDEQVAALLGHG